MARSRRKFSRDIKLQAVRRVVEDGCSVAEVAEEIAIPAAMLHRWIRTVEEQPQTEIFPGNGKLGPQDEEIRRLRREVAQLREDREILKKATEFFAKASK